MKKRLNIVIDITAVQPLFRHEDFSPLHGTGLDA
ncbi:hypothetical protein JOC94_003857 [Bacillus thermophilus]|uniref:Uncharacterized protein n=1 Tax=Siminovitchia thermophila TaxID=1245522 RepID=A0ABS2RDB2_9BACI|nr:hypothetical protein [Siminovitchia thermophila]